MFIYGIALAFNSNAPRFMEQLDPKCRFCGHPKCKMCREVSVSNLACCKCMVRAIKRLEQLTRREQERSRTNEDKEIPLDVPERLPQSRITPKDS
jgi:hypothetical protein